MVVFDMACDSVIYNLFELLPLIDKDAAGTMATAPSLLDNLQRLPVRQLQQVHPSGKITQVQHL
jgi:hypothetical protein